MNKKGRIIWRIVLGVLIAALLFGISITYLQKQREYSKKREAQMIADGISKAVFSALPQERTEYDLPKKIGGSPYELQIEEDTIQIRFTGGNLEGQKFSSTVGVDLSTAENDALPEPGNILNAIGNQGNVIISTGNIAPSKTTKAGTENLKTPAFYHFAKENTKIATGIMAAYFRKENKMGENETPDVKSYSWNQEGLEVNFNGENHAIKITGQGKETEGNTIEKTWFPNEFKKISRPSTHQISPSIKEALKSGWIYSPDQAVSLLRERGFRSEKTGKSVSITENPEIEIICVKTNVSTYPAWKISFESKGENIKIYLGALTWRYNENKPGFTFYSNPPLEVVK